MDVHRDFCEIAIAEQGKKVRSAGRVASTVAALEALAQSLLPDDVVALEATSGAGLIGDLIRPHVGGVLVANTRRLPQISRAKARPTGSTLGRSLGSRRPACSRRYGRLMSARARCGGCTTATARTERAPASRRRDHQDVIPRHVQLLERMAQTRRHAVHGR